MRWTDLPPDSGPADGRGSALPRGEWEELRHRLERLPNGHPSRPDDEPDATAVEDLAGTDLAHEGSDPPGLPEPADPGDGKPAGGQRQARDPAGAEAGHAGPGGLGDLGGHGKREPYRPWFTEGEPPEPWFAADPG